MRSHGCFLALNGVLHSFWPLWKLNSLTYVEKFSILRAQEGEAENSRLSLCQAPLRPGGAQDRGSPTHSYPPTLVHTAGREAGASGKLLWRPQGWGEDAAAQGFGDGHWDLGGPSSTILGTF